MCVIALFFVRFCFVSGLQNSNKQTFNKTKRFVLLKVCLLEFCFVIGFSALCPRKVFNDVTEYGKGHSRHFFPLVSSPLVSSPRIALSANAICS
jgi:hypothetical protein